MAQKKKLQVFISSTYTDLKEERQAAVEAILTAGHIPAGMELFAAGDESQMNVIKRWIDESDVYMLILGGRYGSIEPKSQKSYIQLEYEYALEKEKPLFAVVIEENHLEEKVKKYGTQIIEKEYPHKLKEFRDLICTKMVRFWNDAKDIKLAILETLSEFNKRPELVGWIPGSESINSGAIAEEIARLTRENTQLQKQLENSKEITRYGGLSFNEMFQLLKSKPVRDLSGMNQNYFRVESAYLENRLKQITASFSDTDPNLLHLYWMLSRRFALGMSINAYQANTEVARQHHRLVELGLITRTESTNGTRREIRQFLSEIGREFINRLRVEYSLSEAEKYIL